MSEILAPAGGKESAFAAINSGADAIYLGLTQFSARSSAENFDEKSFDEICSLAHAFKVKVYVAMNTLVKESELEKFLRTLIDVWNRGADAIILSDLYLGKYIHENYPEICLHLSTQAGVCNAYAARIAKNFGFSRVILSRETSFVDIRQIASIIETEVFVQGALCTCFSGQCYLSSFVGGNSGNRGRCKQPCRKQYSIDRNGFKDSAYRLSLSDLSIGDKIFDLIEAGVTSFKIEGRMRRPEYVAAAVKYYKNLLSHRPSESDLSDLKRTYNRGNYSKGLAFGQDKSLISSSVQGHLGEFVGTIKVENGKYFVRTAQKFVKGDCFKILRGGKEVGGAEYSSSTQQAIILTSSVRLLAGDKAFITTDTSLNSRLLLQSRKISVEVGASFSVDKVPEISINGEIFFGEKPLESAKNSPLTRQQIEKCFSKTDKFPFEVNFGEIKIDDVFISISELNALRRAAFENFFNKISRIGARNVIYKPYKTKSDTSKNDEIAVICTRFDAEIFKKADIVIYKPNDYFALAEIPPHGDRQLFLYLPPFLTQREAESLKPAVSAFDGVYCDGIWAIEFARECGKKLFAGCGFNLSNSISVGECAADYVALSKELTAHELQPLISGNTFALSVGVIKVMDLIYCPFEKKCGDCDKREIYALCDESKRKFALRRYTVGACRFELYNCANLVGRSPTGALLDCSLEKSPSKLIYIMDNEQALKEYFENYTRGHLNSPVL